MLSLCQNYPEEKKKLIREYAGKLKNRIKGETIGDLKDGINLEAERNGNLKAALINNALQNNQNYGVSVKSVGGNDGYTTSNVCLQARGNDSQAGYYFESRRSDYGFIEIEADDMLDFQSTNSGSVTVVPDIDDLSFVRVGACGF